jgi:hypothetical protein
VDGEVMGDSLLWHLQATFIEAGNLQWLRSVTSYLMGVLHSTRPMNNLSQNGTLKPLLRLMLFFMLGM